MGALHTEQGSKLREGEVERARCAWLIASDLAARAVGADVRAVMKTRGTVGRGSDELTTKARKIACYLANVVANVTQARLADATGMDRSTILKHARWVEEQRDDAAFETMIAGLEGALVTMALRVVLGRMSEDAILELLEPST